MENLPGDVLSNIFIRLLAKQLAQMRLVCKTWNALLSESSFIKSHLHYSMNNNNNKDEILLFFHKSESVYYFDKFVSLGPLAVRSSRSPHLELPDLKFKFPVNPQHKNPYFTVIGSVNGLICCAYLSNNDCSICIWNPSLSASLTLPPSSLCDNRYYHVMGFGFDPKTDDYKVVKPSRLSISETPNININMETQALGEVYSMRKGSWELISQGIPSNIKHFGRQNQVCLNGHLHWVCGTDVKVLPKKKTIAILTFDLGAMTYGEIPLPDSIQPHPFEYRRNVLGVLSGKLCMMSSLRDVGCDVWVVDDDKSWVKHHVFNQYPCGIIPHGFTSHEEFLFQVGKNGRVFLYDPIAAKTKIFKIKKRLTDILIIFEYVVTPAFPARPIIICKSLWSTVVICYE